ncbi:tRNA(Met) cytidine acetate ligase [uncultured Flavonifractor sp.]|uniref:tRNA(Met) cytidine acetate ligase n=1 Tax=uncultured Flavonifractor sp. TaxID=1193534 RepID=UPI00260EAB64|nr:nucleotidyltransferase family protein [uncultured Flavonifractor sp.]
MTAVGIVAEYNPFHLGHRWHIAQTRCLLGQDCPVVCVMSGHWVQGADCAIGDKWTRAGLALAGGADLVLELPTPWAMASAETFARGAVSLFAASGVVEVLSFGSECGSAAELAQAAAALDHPAYPARLRAALDKGLSFPAARQEAAGCPCLSTPNNNLGVEYLRALAYLNCPLEVVTVPRRGAAHGGTETVEGFASATQIRRLLRTERYEEAASLVPAGTLERLGKISSLSYVERAILAKLRTMDTGAWADLPDSGTAEGLPERLVRAARQALSLNEFYALVKTKRYTHARLRRLALSAFLGLTTDRPVLPPYARVLGLNRRGQALLKRMKDVCTLPILTKPAQAKALTGPARRLFELEARYTDLYSLCFPTPKPCGSEWTTSPVVDFTQPE